MLPPGEHIYGLGDKTGGSLDRRGKSYVDWNTDAYGFDSSTDPIYKSIPFFIATGVKAEAMDFSSTTHGGPSSISATLRPTR